MSIKYFVNKDLIPNDGSMEMVERFHSEAKDATLEISLFPDIHYKRGSQVTNGMMTKSRIGIYPSMLGVTNCGFTAGKVGGISLKDRADIEEACLQYSKILKAYSSEVVYTEEEVVELFYQYAEKDLGENSTLKNLKIDTMDQVKENFHRLIPAYILRRAQKSLGTLGGGNHFFEFHYVDKIYEDTLDYKEGDIYFILHSDSIVVGDMIQLLYSNLHELDRLSGYRGVRTKTLNRLRQLFYFSTQNPHIFKSPRDLASLILSKKAYRHLDASTSLGRDLLLSFYFASVFGEMNRDRILDKFLKTARKTIPDIDAQKMSSHSHDSVDLELWDGEVHVMQRNGVQNIGESADFVLPGALGTESYVLKNPYNKESYNSSNHGVGRILDKHLARNEFNNAATEKKLETKGMKLYRVGSGNISEQNPDAFKNVESVTDVMNDFQLGKKLARIQPIASLKG